MARTILPTNGETGTWKMIGDGRIRILFRYPKKMWPLSDGGPQELDRSDEEKFSLGFLYG